MKTINRFEDIKKIVFETIHQLKNEQLKNGWFHLSSVASLSGLLALKRNLNSEICQTAGILHDLWLYCKLPLELEVHKKHDEDGADFAEAILKESSMYNPEECELICRIIGSHNKKDEEHGEYEETLKDADALQHYINNSDYDQRYNYHGRIKPLLEELGM